MWTGSINGRILRDFGFEPSETTRAGRRQEANNFLFDTPYPTCCSRLETSR